MAYQVLDNGVVRDATPDEEAEIAARASAVPPVPSEVSRRQALQELFSVGITEQMVEDKIAALLASPASDLALIEFRESQVFYRNRPLVQQIGAAFGLDLDARFIAAAARP